jgi:hypothetical protein
MIKLLIIAWISWLVFSALRTIVRRILATRTFHAKREALHFRNEPFLWMRQVV